MSLERPTPPAGGPEVSRSPSILTDGDRSAVGLRLQILSTEHWSLLATRSLTWSESFTRAGMFLSTLSGAVVALALVAQASSFGPGFQVFALVLLPVVLFIGIATLVRLQQANGEDVRWVMGMNRIRHAYMELAPELEPYLITGWHDDAAGFMVTYGIDAARTRPALHGLVTVPGMVGVVDATVAAVLGSLVGLRLGLDTAPATTLGVLVFFGTFAALALWGMRRFRQAATLPSLFPTPPPRGDAGRGSLRDG